MICVLKEEDEDTETPANKGGNYTSDRTWLKLESYPLQKVLPSQIGNSADLRGTNLHASSCRTVSRRSSGHDAAIPEVHI